MRSITFILAILSLNTFSVGSSLTTHSSIQLQQHYESSEYLLKWFEEGMPEKEVKKIATLPGNQIMEQNLIQNTKEDQTICSFETDLKEFLRNKETYKSPYQTNLAYGKTKEISELIEKLQTSQINFSISQRSMAYFPQNVEILKPADIYYVSTGWEWGDAYVRNVSKENNSYQITQSGDPVLIFNLYLITKLYGDNAESQYKTLEDVMAHELFHFAFDQYKKQSGNYLPIPSSDFKNRLMEIVQDEGIAHYIQLQDRIQFDTPKYKEYHTNSFNELNKAFKSLLSDQINNPEKEELLESSNTGKFWDKFGAITGMFMAHSIEQRLGKKQLTTTITEGTDSFFKTYIQLQHSDETLPRLQL